MIKPLSPEWFASRKIRLTGSQWYNILVGGEHKQALLHGRACSDWGERCMRYGQKYEPAALRSVQTYINPSGLVIEQPCLYISKTHSFLAATPDGVIRNKHSQEIMTPPLGSHPPQPTEKGPWSPLPNNGPIKQRDNINYIHIYYNKIYTNVLFIVYTGCAP